MIQEKKTREEIMKDVYLRLAYNQYLDDEKNIAQLSFTQFVNQFGYFGIRLQSKHHKRRLQLNEAYAKDKKATCFIERLNGKKEPTTPLDACKQGWVTKEHIENIKLLIPESKKWSEADSPYRIPDKKRYLYLPNNKRKTDGLGSQLIQHATLVTTARKGKNREEFRSVVYRLNPKPSKKDLKLLKQLFANDPGFLLSPYWKGQVAVHKTELHASIYAQRISELIGAVAKLELAEHSLKSLNQILKKK